MAKHNAIPEETKQDIARDYLEGMRQTEIADKYGITNSTVCKIVGQMKMSEIKEKEPAAAATATDSEEKTVHVKDSTISAESQALRGVNVLGVLQAALENSYGNDAEIMSLKADSDTASVMFKYGEKAYSLQFGLAF